MNRRDMTPDELERVEDDLVRDSDDVDPARPESEPEIAREIDRDEDGLPDKPAAYRVPS